jgi:predicted GNAT family acetyltransferase
MKQKLSAKFAALPDGVRVYLTLKGARVAGSNASIRKLKQGGPSAIGFMDLSEAPSFSDDDLPDGFVAVNEAFVAKEYRRRGLGRKMYDKALAWAKANGYRGLASDTNQRTMAAERFWGKLGTQQVGDWDVWVGCAPSQSVRPNPSQISKPLQNKLRQHHRAVVSNGYQEKTMPIPQVDRKDVEQALRMIDAEGIPPGRGSTRYSLVAHRGGRKECYPPKLVLSYAVQARTGRPLDPSQFSGGAHHANRIFGKLGYSIEQTGPTLCIQAPNALDKLGKLEGRQWVAAQRKGGPRLDNGFFVSMEAHKILLQMGSRSKGLTLEDLDPKAGLITGATGAAYVVFPDGEIALMGDTATEAQRSMAARMMQVV